MSVSNIVWEAESGVPKEPHIRLEAYPPLEGAHLGTYWDMSMLAG